MVEYKCHRCDKLFKQKIDYERHLKRLKPCKTVLADDKNTAPELLPNCSQVAPKSSQLAPNINAHIVIQCFLKKVIWCVILIHVKLR